MVNKKGCRLSSFHDNLPNMPANPDAAQVRRQQTFLTSQAFSRRHADSAHSVLRTIAPMRSDSTLMNNGIYDFRQRFGSNCGGRESNAGNITGKQFPASHVKIVRFHEQKKLGAGVTKRANDYSILPPLDCHAWVSQRNLADETDLTVVSCALTSPSASPTFKPVQQMQSSKIHRLDAAAARQMRSTREKSTMPYEQHRKPEYSTAAFNLHRRKVTNIPDRVDTTLHHSDTQLEITNSRANEAGGLNNLTKRLQISLPFYSHNLGKGDVKTDTKANPKVRLQDEASTVGREVVHISSETHVVENIVEQEYPIKKEDIAIVENDNIVEDSDRMLDCLRNDENKTGSKKSTQCSHDTPETHERLPDIKNDNSARLNTAKTWKSWHTQRDVNDSYAYNDVKQYILENDLMPEDKHMWMTAWLENVNGALFSQQYTSVRTDSPV